MINAKFRRRAQAIALSLSLLSLAACASGARPSQMVAAAGVTPVQAGQPGFKQFRIGQTQGGSETNPLWMANVSNNEFQGALEASLRAANYLADEASSATTEISANMVSLKRPMAGLDLSVTSTVRYSAVDVQDNAVVFDDTVAATGTAKFGDSLLAVERLRLANEAAIKANIESFLARLGEKLSATKVAAAQ